MAYHDDLDQVAEAVRRTATAADMVVLPALPWREEVDVVQWPDPDWGTFLFTGWKLGAQLLYVDEHCFSQAQLRSLWARCPHVRSDATTWTEAAAHLGRVHRLELRWLHGGRVNGWTAVATWHLDLQRRLHQQPGDTEVADAVERDGTPEPWHLVPATPARGSRCRIRAAALGGWSRRRPPRPPGTRRRR